MNSKGILHQSITRKVLVTVVVIYVLVAFVWTYFNMQAEYRPSTNSKLLLLGSSLQLLLMSGLLVWHYIAITRPLALFINSVRALDLAELSNKKNLFKLAKIKATEINFLVEFFNVLLNKLYNTKSNLLETQERLRSIINSMPSVIIGVTEAGTITDWNTQAADVTQVSIWAAKGNMLAQVYPAYESYLGLAKQAMMKNSIQKYTKQAREVARETRYFDIVVYPVVNNNYHGAVIRIDDVTSQVLLEDIMAQTEKMNSIGGLAAGVAHEINNPLGSIIQGGQNVLRRLDPTLPKNIALAKQLGVDIVAVGRYVKECHILDFVHGIREAGARAANIVNNLLQFTRTTNAQKAMNCMRTVIENSLELASTDYNLQKKMDFRHIKVIKDYQANLPNIYCCAMELEQVMLNLLKNAAYASQMVARSPVIYIKMWTERDVLILEIQDNGPGIKEELKKKIFDPFFTTKPVGEGTGLGLSVSFNIIVERHGGSFSVESTEGEGAKFIIVLPIISVTTGDLKDYLRGAMA